MSDLKNIENQLDKILKIVYLEKGNIPQFEEALSELELLEKEFSKIEVFKRNVVEQGTIYVLIELIIKYLDKKGIKYDEKKGKEKLDLKIDVKGIKEYIIKFLSKLPYKYEVFIQLKTNIQLSENLKEVFITQGVSLVKSSTNFLQIYENQLSKRDYLSDTLMIDFSKPENHLLSSQPSFNKDQIYLRYEIEGLILKYEDLLMFNKAINQLKLIIGLMYSMNLLIDITDWKKIQFPSIRDLKFFENTKKNYITRIALTSELYMLINKLKINDIWLKEMNDEVDKENEVVPRAIVLNVYNSAEGEEKAKIKRAIKWYVDGLSANNVIYGIIFATVSLETLLGDKNKEEITKRLADRVALLLSTKISDRNIFRKQIEQVYDSRSEILHSGKDMITKEHKFHLLILKRYLKSLIQKEIFRL